MRAVATARKNYAVLLRCPHRDHDAWVVQENRKESLEEILGMAWDFECPVHGVQREMPVSVSEKASAVLESKPNGDINQKRASARVYLKVPVRVYGWVRSKGAFHDETSTIVINAGGCLVYLETKVDMGDMLFIVNRASNQELQCRVAYIEEDGLGAKVGLAFKAPMPRFWEMHRNNRPRIARTIEVLVKGVDRKGDPYTQTACTINISERGARLDGLAGITGPGEIIDVKHGWRKARYRVMWIGPPGTAQANQIGICCMEDGKNIWGSALKPSKRK